MKKLLAGYIHCLTLDTPEEVFDYLFTDRQQIILGVVGFIVFSILFIFV